jgi:hypothetical protein
MLNRSLLCAVSLFLLLGCPRKAEQAVIDTAPKPGPVDAKTREAIAEVAKDVRSIADLTVKEAAAANALGKDAAVTDAIRQYEALSAADRLKFVVDKRLDHLGPIADDDDELAKSMTHADNVWARLTGFGLLKITPVDFDLKIAKMEVFAQQTQLTNEVFGDMHPAAVTAVQAFQKMTPEQKRSLMMRPPPDGAAMVWQQAYLLRKLSALQRYRMWTPRMYAYAAGTGTLQTSAIDDRQFDLQIAQR